MGLQMGEVARSGSVMALLHIEILLANKTIRVVTLPDRRPNASSSQPLKWLYQIDLELVLYGSNNDNAKSTGAVYRLLTRTPGAAGRALCLRKTSIAGGLITEAEWESLREHLHTGVRSFTLVPVDVVVKAATVFGETQASARLVEALGYDRPAEWDEESGGEEEEEEGEEEEEEGEEDESDSAERSGGRSEASVAATEEFEYNEKSNDDAADVGEGQGDDGSGSADDGLDQQRQAKKARIATYTLVDVPPALERELEAFAKWRLKPINRDRDGVSVETITVAGNRSDALRLLGWLKRERNIAPSLGGVFGSERLGLAVQAFMDHLRSCGRTYGTSACYVKSYIALNGHLRSEVRVVFLRSGNGGGAEQGLY